MKNSTTTQIKEQVREVLGDLTRRIHSTNGGQDKIKEIIKEVPKKFTEEMIRVAMKMRAEDDDFNRVTWPTFDEFNHMTKNVGFKIMWKYIGMPKFNMKNTDKDFRFSVSKVFVEISEAMKEIRQNLKDQETRIAVLEKYVLEILEKEEKK